MSQQINLINPSLIKQKDFLNTTNIAITLGLLSVLLLGYYSYAQQKLSILTMQRSQIAEELSATQATLQQTVLLHTPHEMNKALLDQITQLEHKAAMQEHILQTVKQSSATPEKGYAALMHAFAKQSVDGLWLTSFSVDSRSEQLNINGRTLQGDLVPEYISRLSNEPALKGKLFAALNMSLPKAEASANTNTPVTIAPVATASIIKNGISAMPANTSSPAVAAQNNEPQYIEFSLQSTDEKSAVRTTAIDAGGKL